MWYRKRHTAGAEIAATAFGCHALWESAAEYVHRDDIRGLMIYFGIDLRDFAALYYCVGDNPFTH